MKFALMNAENAHVVLSCNCNVTNERCRGAQEDCLREYRDWSKELAYARRACRDSSDSLVASGGGVADEALCMEKRLDCELDGVSVSREGEDAGLSAGKKLDDCRGDGVGPWAEARLPARREKVLLVVVLEGHEKPGVCCVGDDAAEPEGDFFSNSARRHDSEQ